MTCEPARSPEYPAAVPDQDPVRLTLTLDGPLVDEHRLPLSELLRIGKQLRDSLRDVAVVLARYGPSGTAGRTKKVVEDSVDLRVVAAPRPGSFTLDLETPPEAPAEQERLATETGPALSERAIVALLDGLEALTDETEHLPPGFDRGVLRAIVPFRTALRNGITQITMTTSRGGRSHVAAITQQKVDIAERLIRRPIRGAAVVEGVLQMVDFGSLECRVDRAGRPGVAVYFDEQARDLVHEAVRQYVRVVGEGQFEPEGNEPSKIWASRIEILYETLELDAGAHWREQTVDELAQEQRAPAYSLPAQLDNDPWRDDDDAAALIAAIHAVE